MVQKILLTLEIDDSALDTAQAKADKLIATLKEAEGLMAKRTQASRQTQGGNLRDLWQEAFEKGLVAIPPPEQSQAKEKPPEGGDSCKCEDMADRLNVVKDLAKDLQPDEWEEFEKACRPAVEFLQKRYHLHAHIIIDWDRATLVKDLKGLPFKVPD